MPKEDDAILYEANPSMFRDAPFRFIIYLIFCFLLIGIPVMVGWWLACKCTKLTVTSQKVILRRGFLSKELNEVRHEHIRNVQLRQNLTQRIFDVGWIGISTAGQAGLEIEVDGIPHPAKVKSIIDSRT